MEKSAKNARVSEDVACGWGRAEEILPRNCGKSALFSGVNKRYEAFFDRA